MLWNPMKIFQIEPVLSINRISGPNLHIRTAFPRQESHNPYKSLSGALYTMISDGNLPDSPASGYPVPTLVLQWSLPYKLCGAEAGGWNVRILWLKILFNQRWLKDRCLHERILRLVLQPEPGAVGGGAGRKKGEKEKEVVWFLKKHMAQAILI